MTIQQILQQQPDIVCDNEEEKAQVIEILEREGLKKYHDGGGLYVTVLYNRQYKEYATCNVEHAPLDDCLLKIPAQQFINANK